jgi:hypothetical protein
MAVVIRSAEDEVASQVDADLQRVVRSALAVAGIDSAVVFAVQPGSADLELAAAAGIEGPALEGLASAVRSPGHPISRTFRDEIAAYDVKPTAPGGPALRSHLPLIARDADRHTVNGVMALAHQRGLAADARRALEGLADTAAALVGRRRRKGSDDSG